MKTFLKYFFSYIIFVIILTLSFSKGFLEIEHGIIGGIILVSMGFSLFPIVLYVAAIKAKILLPITLFIIFSEVIIYLYIQTQEDKVNTWFKYEQIRQLFTLFILIITATVFGLYKGVFSKRSRRLDV